LLIMMLGDALFHSRLLIKSHANVMHNVLTLPPVNDEGTALRTFPIGHPMGFL